MSRTCTPDILKDLLTGSSFDTELDHTYNPCRPKIANVVLDVLKSVIFTFNGILSLQGVYGWELNICDLITTNFIRPCPRLRLHRNTSTGQLQFR